MTLRDRLKGPIEQPNWKLSPELLLHPNIPMPMHGVAPRIVLGSTWWNQERVAAYRKVDYHCEACGVKKVHAAYHRWLEGHEIYDINYTAGRMVYVRTASLCHFCHNYIHSGRLKSLLEKGEIHHAKYVDIIQHGDRVLKQNGLKKLPVHNGKIAEWNEWRLVIEFNGGIIEIPPVHKSFEAWQEAHDIES